MPHDGDCGDRIVAKGEDLEEACGISMAAAGGWLNCQHVCHDAPFQQGLPEVIDAAGVLREPCDQRSDRHRRGNRRHKEEEKNVRILPSDDARRDGFPDERQQQIVVRFDEVLIYVIAAIAGELQLLGTAGPGSSAGAMKPKFGARLRWN